MPSITSKARETRINPEILKWARETAGLSPEDAIQKLGIKASRDVSPIARLAQLETGEAEPSRPMLVKMSKQYHRPILTFYLSAPPQTGDRDEDFRTLPDTFALTDKALADAVVRDIKARQSLVRNILEEEGEAIVLPFIGSAEIEDGPSVLASKIRETLEFDLQKYRRLSPIGKSVTYLRERAEAVGVFVLFVDNLGSFHTEIPVEVFRGFALADNVAPFIAVNANDSKGAQSFTIVHELAHLWLGLSGVSGQVAERRVEKFCNDVAAEFLLPVSELASLSVTDQTDFNEAVRMIGDFASARKISSKMVAYRLHRAGAFSYAYCDRISRIFRQAYLSGRERDRSLSRATKGGPSYPVIRGHRAGPALVGLVERMLGAGALTTTKAGKVLGVSGKSVQSVLRSNEPQLRA